MSNLIRIEWLKLRTTFVLPITALITIGLALASSISNIVLAGRNGAPPIGTDANVTKVFNQPAAVTCMAMFILGVLAIAGEYRQRTIMSTYLAQPHRSRVLLAKLLTMSVVGAALAAITFGVTLAAAVPIYAVKGVHTLNVEVVPLWTGTIVGGACFAMLGVALGALTRNVVAAIVGGLIWIQLIEVALLQNAFPAIAKWLPTGAAVALTDTHRSAHLLAPAAGALILVGWAIGIAAVATRISARREVR